MARWPRHVWTSIYTYAVIFGLFPLLCATVGLCLGAGLPVSRLGSIRSCLWANRPHAMHKHLHNKLKAAGQEHVPDVLGHQLDEPAKRR